ncbi:MAG TPA: ATP-binding protein [Thermoanaerobaculia bacterium]
MIDRLRHLERLAWLFRTFPVVAILGARQVGKTTLARAFGEGWRGPVTHLDLESAADLALLADPELALGPLQGLVILDEIQRRPELFPVLRVLVDRPGSDTKFLVLGSASPDLLRQSSESLAGRIGYHRLHGLALDEIGPDALDRLWVRGGFPRSFLAAGEAESVEWRRSFLQTFLERDLPQLGIRTPAETLRRFWSMVAHYHAQTWNGAEIARAFGVGESSVRRYLDLLTDALVLRQLPPWHANLGKRQVRSPKVFVEDSGLLHTLLGIENGEDLAGHPKVGASWEGFLIKEIIERLNARPEECFFWATHTGAELDLLIVSGRRRHGFEVKRTTAPRLTRSMATVLEDLDLERLDVVHAGDATFPLARNVRAVAAHALLDQLEPLRKP